jgi:hypothetical protein
MRGRRIWVKLQTQRGELRVYVVKWVLKDDDGNVADALYDSDNNCIEVTWGPDDNFMKMKLLHELLHVCFSPHSGDIKYSVLGGNLLETRWFREEMVVSFLEPVLYDLLTRNALLKFPKPPKV